MFYGNGNSYSSANISNIRSFNNTNDGLYLYAISGTSFSNIVSFNNGGKGIHSPDSYSNF